MSVPIVYLKKGCTYCDVLLELIHFADQTRPDLGISAWEVHDKAPYPPNVQLAPTIYDPAQRIYIANALQTTRFVLTLLASAGPVQAPRRDTGGSTLSSRDAPSQQQAHVPQQYAQQPQQQQQQYAQQRMQASNGPSFQLDKEATLDGLYKVARDLPDELFNAQTCNHTARPI